MDATVKRILRDAKRSLLIAGFLACVALGLWQGLAWTAEAAEQQQQAAEAARDQAAEERARLQRDLDEIEAHLAEWRRWQEAGLIGAGDRPGWFEAASGIRLGSLPAPSLTLEAAQPVAGHAGAYRHRLEARFTGIVETEALDWLGQVRAAVRAPLRVARLVFQKPGEDGLEAELSLDLFHFDPAAVEKTDSPAESGGASMNRP